MRNEAETENALGVLVLRTEPSESVNHSQSVFNAFPCVLNKVIELKDIQLYCKCELIKSVHDFHPLH